MSLHTWHKHESAGNSEIGTNPTAIGTGGTFAAAKYNNGLHISPALEANTLQYQSLAFTATKFSLGFWAKMNQAYADISAGLKTISWYTYGATVSHLAIAWNNGNFYISLTDFNDGYSYGFDYTFTNAVNFLAGDSLHIGIVFDQSAAAGSKIRVFHNGSELSKTAYSDAGTFDNSAFSWLIGRPGSPGWATTIDCDIDNPKFYDNEAKTDWSDIYFEGDGIPTGMTASDGTYTGYVALSCDEVIGDTIEYQLYRATTSGGSFSAVSGWQSGRTYNDTTAVPETVYYYKAKARSAVNNYESAYSSEDSGYAVAAAISAVTETILEAKPRVIVLGNVDLYARGYINKLNSIKIEKTFRGQKLILNEFDILVKNFGNEFSMDNSKSFFHGINNPQIDIYDDENTHIFSGKIINIPRTHKDKTASLKISDTISKKQTQIISYVSTDWETPANAVKNILDNYSVLYDENALNTSIATYTANSCYIKCVINTDDNLSLQSAIEKIAEIGCADAWIYLDKIYFKAYKPFTGGVKKHLVLDDLNEPPSVDMIFDSLINDYSIKYYGCADTAVTDAGENNIGGVSRTKNGTRSLVTIDGKEDTQIMLKDETSAVYIGECYIKKTHRFLSTLALPRQALSFTMPLKNREWVDINTYFRLTFSEEEWTDKLFEIFGVEINMDGSIISILAYDVEES